MVMVPPVMVVPGMVPVELAPGPFVTSELGPTFAAGAEPVEGTLVLLLRMSHEVSG